MKDNIETYPDNEILQNMKCTKKKNNIINKIVNDWAERMGGIIVEKMYYHYCKKFYFPILENSEQ